LPSEGQGRNGKLPRPSFVGAERAKEKKGWKEGKLVEAKKKGSEGQGRQGEKPSTRALFEGRAKLREQEEWAKRWMGETSLQQVGETGGRLITDASIEVEGEKLVRAKAKG